MKWIWSALSESRYANGANEKDRQNIDERLILRRLVSNAEARSLAAQEKISGAEGEGELNLLRWQFRDEKSWTSALQFNGLSVGSLRRNVADDLRARHWVFRQITSHADVTADECRGFYEANQDSFLQPARLRASHLFLAAPPETPPEIVDAKRVAIESLSTRLASGENFAELVGEASEDEATKTRGGDLGYFSVSRMPTDFFFEVLNLRVGQISQPIRTRLGFHLVELTDPPRKSWMSIFALMPAGWAGRAKRPFDRELLDCVATHFTAGSGGGHPRRDRVNRKWPVDQKRMLE